MEMDDLPDRDLQSADRVMETENSTKKDNQNDYIDSSVDSAPISVSSPADLLSETVTRIGRLVRAPKRLDLLDLSCLYF